MRTNAALKTLITVAGLTCGSACGGSTPPPPRPPPANQVRWEPLNLPQADITLPSFMVGEHRQLDSGCWKHAEVTTSPIADQVAWTQERQGNLAASVRAEFSKYLVQAGLDASLARAFTQTWTLDLAGVSYASVTPSLIRPDFENEACTIDKLEWFKNDRFVVTQAIRADKAIISATSNASAEQKAKLDLAIAAINAELHTDFKNLEADTGQLRIEASNVFIGAIGTRIEARSCTVQAPVTLASGSSLKVCNDEYSIAVAPAAQGDQFTLSVTPRAGQTEQFDEKFGVQRLRQLGEHRIVFASVSRQGGALTLDNLSILLVGAKG